MEMDDNRPNRCIGRMTRSKFKIHGSIIYSEKRCNVIINNKNNILCERCRTRPQGPKPHGNQEGYQVNQGVVNSNYMSWSSIYGSERYKSLIKKNGSPPEDILRILEEHQKEARCGLNVAEYVNKESKELKRSASNFDIEMARLTKKYSEEKYDENKKNVTNETPPRYQVITRELHMIREIQRVSCAELLKIIQNANTDSQVKKTEKT